ncbi:MAG: hypothetical protein KAH23_01700 [Kiritimatiellae bacterium]|nr:hypothetical protein [Kiritimatiellia bacterium]
MNLEQIEAGVSEIIQDESFSERIKDFVNMGINEIAGAKKLATLDTADSVDCLSTLDRVALPDDYLHGLYYVSDGESIIGVPAYYDKIARFLRYAEGISGTGKIVDVVLDGNFLRYRQRETKTLHLRYFGKPTLLEKLTDVPDFLPEHLQEGLLVNYAASKIFNLIEDGIEDPKTNTRMCLSAFQGALSDLTMYTIETDQPVYVQDEYR